MSRIIFLFCNHYCSRVHNNWLARCRRRSKCAGRPFSPDF